MTVSHNKKQRTRTIADPLFRFFIRAGNAHFEFGRPADSQK